jgi:enamine deaminase RidA (YjgF/YER057c/UK114 family)
MEHVVRTTVYLTTVEDSGKMNKVYASFFKVPPPRAAEFAKGWGDPHRLIEIDAIAGMP